MSLPSVIVRSSAAAPSGISRYVFEVALAALLVAELLYLTVTFDTQVLDNLDTRWARFLNWAPQYLRLASTIVVVTLLFSTKDVLRNLTRLGAPAARVSVRSMYLAVH